MKVIYIAAPYRASTEWQVEQNIRTAERAALQVWQNGGVALCPHKNTAHFGGAAPDATWLAGDLELLSRCDAIWPVGQWTMSEGARDEVEQAAVWGLPILENFVDVIAFLDGMYDAT